MNRWTVAAACAVVLLAGCAAPRSQTSPPAVSAQPTSGTATSAATLTITSGATVTVPKGWSAEWSRRPVAARSATVSPLPDPIARIALNTVDDSADLVTFEGYASKADLDALLAVNDSIVAMDKKQGEDSRRRFAFDLDSGAHVVGLARTVADAGPNGEAVRELMVFIGGPAGAPVRIVASLSSSSAVVAGAKDDVGVTRALLGHFGFRE